MTDNNDNANPLVITADFLRRRGACSANRFAQLFPDGSPDTLDDAIIAARECSGKFNWGWAAERLLPSAAQRQAYKDAKALLWQAYNEAEAPLWQAYRDAVAPLWQAYEDAEAPLWQAYEDAEAPLLQAYEDAKAPLLQAYEDAKAPLWQAYKDAEAEAFARAWFTAA